MKKIVNIKEIKSIKLTSFTLMASSTALIMAFIYSIIILAISGVIVAFVPQLGAFGGVIGGLGIASIIVLPLIAYFLVMPVSFFAALLYNGFASRLGGIKLELSDNEIVQISILPFSLILACIEAVLALIMGLFLAAAVAPFTLIISRLIQFIAETITSTIDITGTALPINAIMGTDGFVLSLFLIIGFPLTVFLFGFLSNVLFTVFYNYMATRVIRIQLELKVISGTLNEITSLPIVPSAAPVSAAVFAALGVIMGLINLLSLAVTGNPGVGNIVNATAVLLINGLSYFVGYFLIFALVAVIYNFLAPRIGGIRFNIE